MNEQVGEGEGGTEAHPSMILIISTLILTRDDPWRFDFE
jgi:hypothetical protein